MPDHPIKIVIFTPTSQIHPAIGTNIMAGARIALEEAGTRAGVRKLELIERQLPVDPTKAPEVITRSVGTDRPDFIVAVLNSKIVARLREFCDLHRQFLIVATVGANITREAEMSPYIYRVSLNYWQSNYVMGQWLAGKLGKRIMAIPTMLDAGYDSYALFHAGVEAAGGSVVRWYMADGTNFALNIPPVLEDVRNTKPDAVFALACGGKAISLVRAYKEAGLHKEFPLFVNSFAVEEPCLSALGDTAIGLKSVFSWAEGLVNPGSARFRTSFLASAVGSRRWGRGAQARDNRFP
jgi:branched-chain amino acid transport system substrate-binding protein